MRREDVLDLLADPHQRMDAAERQLAARQRDVDGAGGGRAARAPARSVDRRLDLLLERVDQRAELAPRLRRQRAERLHQPGDAAGLAARGTRRGAP